MSNQEPQPVPPRWLHWCAVLTVAATLPLLFLGAEVTTKGVGMVDQRPVVAPHRAVREFAEPQSLGWRIEHAHRLAGWFVGLCGIVLAAGAWWTERRLWMRWLASAALALICIQGLLGIFRVALNNSGLAWIHGCFAQIVFAALVGVALLTSRRWFEQPSLPSISSPMRIASLVTVVLVYAQLVLGGLVRHENSVVTARLHLIGAFVTLAAILWLAKLMFDHKESFRWSLRLLVGLAGLQILLGVEAWLSWSARFFNPASAIYESVAVHLLRSAHYLLGALIFATTVVIALKAHRHAVVATSPTSLSPGQWEGVA